MENDWNWRIAAILRPPRSALSLALAPKEVLREGGNSKHEKDKSDQTDRQHAPTAAAHHDVHHGFFSGAGCGLGSVETGFIGCVLVSTTLRHGTLVRNACL